MKKINTKSFMSLIFSAFTLLLIVGCNSSKKPDISNESDNSNQLLEIKEAPSGPDPYTEPELGKTAPAIFDLPVNFKLPKDGKRRLIGSRWVVGVLLEPQQGIHPFCIVSSRKGSFTGDPLLVRDVVIAIDGEPLGKDAVKQYQRAINEARKTTGFVWVTRWRKGEVTNCILDLETLPLDLTKTGTPGKTRDWRLGPLGASGWCFTQKSREGASRLARQIMITAVDKDGPSAGKLQMDDIILGVDGKKFTYDARKALAHGIDEAEKEESKSELNLLVWRKGNEQDISLKLPVMGAYSKTTPFNCPKTEQIINHAVDHIKRNKATLLEPSDNGWINYINGLGLLATGREDVMPMVKELAHASLLKEGETLSVEKHISMVCWWWSYKTIFLCEYYLRTGDKAVLPTIEEHATKIAMGQSGAGTWGHTYAARENTGYLHGHLGGYGAINQIGQTLMLTLPLAEKCGIKNKEITDAIKRGNQFFGYFIGRGAIPYGDHPPHKEWFDDNGKSGTAAIYFDLVGNRKGTEFFSEMVLGSAPNGREEGHTGHFWSHLWGGVGAARSGDKSLQVFMKEMNPIFTLERQPDGRFVFQDNAGENGRKGDPKNKWDSTGSRLLQLCVPKHSLYITGKETPRETHLTQKRIEQLLQGGRLSSDQEARATLTLDEIFELLQDPLPPIRSTGARTLAERDINCVDKLIAMLDSKNKYARYGAAEGLCQAGFGSKDAANKLIRLMEEDDDILFKSYAIEALINRDTNKGLINVAKPAIPVLLKMAVQHSLDDPRQVLQQVISTALFYKGNAQPRVGLLHKYGLGSAPRDLLIPAIEELLTNQNGGTRSVLGWVYPKLTKAETKLLWGDIYQSSHEIAPSGIMFASEVRTYGLNVMADHHIKEGLDLAVWYIRHQKNHGSPRRIPTTLDAILKYKYHAKRIIQDLEKHLPYWEARKNPNKLNSPNHPANLIRAAIKKIQAMPDQPKFELISIADKIEKGK